MAYEVRVVQLTPSTIACARKRIRWSEIASNVRPLFDAVYAFLRTAPVKPDGHNVCIYHALSETEVEMETGVQVSAEFASGADIHCSATPGGRAATTSHIGPYDQLHRAYKALIDWCDAHDEKRSSHSWELYGDWTDDPTKLRTDVFWLLQ